MLKKEKLLDNHAIEILKSENGELLNLVSELLKSVFHFFFLPAIEILKSENGELLNLVSELLNSVFHFFSRGFFGFGVKFVLFFSGDFFGFGVFCLIS